MGKVAESLIDWLERGEQAELCNVIVEADLAPRRVRPLKAGGKTIGVEVRSTPDRKDRFDELGRFLQQVGVETIPLASAGAFSVRATPAQVSRIAESPLVRKVVSNRPLKVSS